MYTMRLNNPQEEGLYNLTEWLKPNLIALEIGSYAGESADIFLSSGKVRVLFCVDPWLEHYDSSDYASESNMGLVESHFNERMQKYNNFVKIKQKSENASNMFPNDFFDLIYIDGDHREEMFEKDVKLWLPKLKKDGWLSGHDLGHIPIMNVLDRNFKTRPNAAFKDGSWVYFKPHENLKNGDGGN